MLVEQNYGINMDGLHDNFSDASSVDSVMTSSARYTISTCIIIKLAIAGSIQGTRMMATVMAIGAEQGYARM